MRGPLLVMLLAAAAVARAACRDGGDDAQAVAEARAAVDVRCPCAAAASHLAYVHCAARVVAECAAQGLLPRGCRTRVKRCAARSVCGRPGAVTCCGGSRAGSGCRVAPSAANCTRRGGSPGTAASCCVGCRPAPEVAFVERPCPSLWAPPACAPGPARRTCHEAFSGAACNAGPDDRATSFTPEDGPAGGGRSRAWSFPIRPRGRTFHNWCSVQPTVDAPLDVDALLAQAAAWTGPVEGAGWLYGTIASQHLEADLWIRTLLGVRPYDYVMLLSDHAMSHNRHASPFCGRHEDPPAFLGIFALAGPGLRAGADLGMLSPLDVAPTLAYLLGLPVSQALPGRVVTEAFTAEHLASHPIRTVPRW